MVKKPSRAKIEIIFFIVFSIFFRAFGVRFALAAGLCALR